MKSITTKQLEEAIKNGEHVNIIDVRENEEVAEGIIPSAEHISLGNIPHALDYFNKDEHYYIICRSGGRSAAACEFLTENGYNVTNVEGGMLAWEGETIKGK